MKTYYHIDYTHSTGVRSKQTTSILQLSIWLDQALEDVHVVPGSIVLNTEKK